MKGLFVFLISAIFLTATSVAQSPDSWRGLQVGMSTVEDAVSILGQPKKDKTGQKLYTSIGDWINKNARYRKLEYEKLEGIKKASLYFSMKGLSAIELDLKEQVNPNALQEAYGVEFVPKVGGLARAANPQEYEHHEGQVYPKQYPLNYDLIAVSPTSYIVAQVVQGTFAHVGKSLAGVEDDGISFPGKVWRVQLISRGEQDKSGLDALK